MTQLTANENSQPKYWPVPLLQETLKNRKPELRESHVLIMQHASDEIRLDKKTVETFFYTL